MISDQILGCAAGGEALERLNNARWMFTCDSYLPAMPTKTRKQKTGKPKTRKPKQNVWQVGMFSSFSRKRELTVVPEALIGVRYDVDGLAVRVDWADYGKKSRTYAELLFI